MKGVYIGINIYFNMDRDDDGVSITIAIGGSRAR